MKTFVPKIVTLAALKAKADTMELKAADFLTEKGEYARKYKATVYVRFTFIDGVELCITKQDADTPEFASYSFKLRPSRNN